MIPMSSSHLPEVSSGGGEQSFQETEKWNETIELGGCVFEAQSKREIETTLIDCVQSIKVNEERKKGERAQKSNFLRLVHDFFSIRRNR